MTKPVWGCPWHGLVRGGQLTLTNGQQRAWPQPEPRYDLVGGVSTAIPDTWGAAHRLAVPGVPAVVRTAAEQSADTAASRQWRSTATLSGARQALYGTPLDGWIYVDPNGARWRVQCSGLDETILHSFASPLTATVTLSRFGEIEAPAESYSYAISCDWGLDGASPPDGGRTLLDAFKSDGSAAIVMVHERRVIASEPQIRWPHSFLEITIGGAGSSAVVTCAVLKSRSAVASGTTSWPVPTSYLAGYYGGPPAYSSTDWRVSLQGDPTPPGEGNFSEWGGRTVDVYAGPVSVDLRRTLAIWYDASGARVDVDFVVAWDGNLSMPLPAEPGSVTQTGSANWTAAIEVGGAQQSQVSGSWSATTVETADGWTQNRTVVVDGQAYSDSWSGPISATSYAPLAFDSAVAYRDGATPWLVASSTTFSDHLAVVRYSPQVIGLRADRPSAYAYHPPATPSGVAAGAVVVSDGSRQYGSHDPYSGACAWLETSPVCYI